ncbi:MAG: hypothetical protein ACE5J3_01630, partial [Methanosarcinales archaeon]
MSEIIINIPEYKYKEFKLLAKKKRISESEAVISAIEKWLRYENSIDSNNAKVVQESTDYGRSRYNDLLRRIEELEIHLKEYIDHSISNAVKELKEENNFTEKVVWLRSIPKEQAKKEILELYEKSPQPLYYSDIV